MVKSDTEQVGGDNFSLQGSITGAFRKGRVSQRITYHTALDLQNGRFLSIA